jgi:hypothetical protein
MTKCQSFPTGILFVGKIAGRAGNDDGTIANDDGTIGNDVIPDLIGNLTE